jgi:hypothetical protein
LEASAEQHGKYGSERAVAAAPLGPDVELVLGGSLVELNNFWGDHFDRTHGAAQGREIVEEPARDALLIDREASYAGKTVEEVGADDVGIPGGAIEPRVTLKRNVSAREPNPALSEPVAQAAARWTKPGRVESNLAIFHLPAA